MQDCNSLKMKIKGRRLVYTFVQPTTEKKEDGMKKNFMVGLLATLFLAGLNGCCNKIMPRKIVFTPELNLAIKNKISEQNLKAPIVLLIGDDGRTFAMAANGEAFTPCRPPNADEISSANTDETKKNMKQTDKKVQRTVMESDLPICRGMKDTIGIYSVENIAIMRVRVNPVYKLVRTADGMLEMQCTRLPWEPPNVCQ
jgi:hypothetical protein